MLTFDDNEAGYLKWVNDNPKGFVINVPKQHVLVPDMLHKASCTHITTDQRTNYTTGDYKKLCFVDRKELADYSGDFQVCKVCKPIT
jgi:hypothetical protein